MGHDANALVGQLRDHLVAHDRTISFLFGAGTSCCVNGASGPLIPAIAEMTKQCQAAIERLGDNEKAVWARLVAECGDLGIAANIESILGRIRSKLDSVTGTDSVSGLDRRGWDVLDQALRIEIARLVSPDLTAVTDSLPHHDFARWCRNTSRKQPVEVFTTNYDVLFERSFDSLRVPHFDGFIGSQHAYFCAEAVEDERFLPPSSWVRYWKIHGSVSWTLETVGNEKRITRRLPVKTGEMILPSHRKYDESRKEPYRSLMDRLDRVLSRQGSLLIASGYSFSDQHINTIVFDALEHHPQTHLIALMYGEVDDQHPLVKRALSTPNLVVVARNAAVIAQRFDKWHVPGNPDPQTVAATYGLVRAHPTDPNVPVMHAGDFGAFTQFLRQIQGGTP